MPIACDPCPGKTNALLILPPNLVGLSIAYALSHRNLSGAKGYQTAPIPVLSFTKVRQFLRPAPDLKGIKIKFSED
jgi:hypothetical protein